MPAGSARQDAPHASGEEPDTCLRMASGRNAVVGMPQSCGAAEADGLELDTGAEEEADTMTDEYIELEKA